jgi:cobalt-zinc-cadmium efflux system membrane fusion protein
VSAQTLPTDEIVAPGKIEANPTRVSKVVLPVTGRVVNVFVHIGDAVAKDQPLLDVQSPDADGAESAYLSAQATIRQAESTLAKAQADYDRSTDLFAHDAVARKEVLADENTLTQAKAALAQAEAVEQQTVRRLNVLGLRPGAFDERLIVRAPNAGKVLEMSVAPGQFVNDQNAALMTIADLTTVWVTSQVPESYIRFVQLGERIDISLVAYPDETFEGKVSRIADTVDPQTRTVKVQAEMNNRAGRLRPEMYGSIHHIESMAATTVVPQGAVVQIGGTAAVFVQRSPGQFERRTVAVGKPTGTVIRVSHGLSTGDVVVIDGAMLLEGLMRKG